MISEYALGFLSIELRSITENLDQIAVREAFAHVATGAKDRIYNYLETHPSGKGKEADLRDWSLAAYKLTYDGSERFAQYRDIHWTANDFERFDDEDSEADAEAEEDFREMLASENVSVSPERRYSFAWLLSDQVFSLLGELTEA